MLALIVLGGSAAQDPAAEFEEIQRIFKDNCWRCHGPEKQKGRLRLDSKTLALEGGLSGKVILPGNGKDSPLVRRLVEADPDERMPLKAPPLPSADVDRIRAWIDRGAPWPDSASAAGATIDRHWAHVKPVRADPPQVRNAAWARTPVDVFVLRELEARGLSPRPEALQPTLLRRVTLDLIGVVPTPEELDAFGSDPAPDAYEKVVDRLLADPRYGERWGRHWMDVWRYSDWAGYGKEIRESALHIWRWRDWIVESLNADKGYDRMIVEMLAGDELAPEDPATVRATGFVARNWQRYSRDLWLQTLVEHTAKAFLATTLNCARCHSHFFDPISHAEYYRFRAIFEPHDVRTDLVPGQSDATKDGIARAYDAKPDAATYLYIRGNEKNPDTSKTILPGVPRALGGSPFRVEPVALPPAATAPDRRDFVRRDLAAAAEREAASLRAQADAAFANIARIELENPSDALAKALAELPGAVLAAEAAEGKAAALQAVFDVERIEDTNGRASGGWTEAAVRAARLQRRQALLEARRDQFNAARRAGEAKRAPKAAAEGEAAAKKLAQADEALAKAVASDKAPPSAEFTPRKLPAYPQTSTGRRLALARWIADPENPLTARVAANHIWLRHFGRPIVPTVFEFGKHGRPPTHPALLDWLATELVRRGWTMKQLHRLLVTSSVYRTDSGEDPGCLAADPENRFLWRTNARRMEAEAVRDSVLHASGDLDRAMGGPEIDPGLGLSSRRRSLYFRHAQEKQVEFLTIFDGANVSECYERYESIAPQQALALSNSSLVQEEARALAQRLSREAASPREFLDVAFERILGRAPRGDERSLCERFLADQAALLTQPSRLTAFAAGAPAGVGPSGDPSRRAREDLIQVLFNHNDFVTIR